MMLPSGIQSERIRCDLLHIAQSAFEERPGIAFSQKGTVRGTRKGETTF